MALALGSRRSTIAAVTSAVAAVAVAIAVARGRREPGPDDVLRDLMQAAKTDDVELVYELLGPKTRDALEIEAKRATDYVGAAIRYTAKDLISISTSDTVAPPTDLVVEHEAGNDSARVLVVSEGGERVWFDAVRVEGAWRIELPSYGPLDNGNSLRGLR